MRRRPRVLDRTDASGWPRVSPSPGWLLDRLAEHISDASPLYSSTANFAASPKTWQSRTPLVESPKATAHSSRNRAVLAASRRPERRRTVLLTCAKHPRSPISSSSARDERRPGCRRSLTGSPMRSGAKALRAGAHRRLRYRAGGVRSTSTSSSTSSRRRRASKLRLSSRMWGDGKRHPGVSAAQRSSAGNIITDVNTVPSILEQHVRRLEAIQAQVDGPRG